MPAWPGGPCPSCGEEMPPNLIHCQVCRTLLNEDLQTSTVEVPACNPLPEIEDMLDVRPSGYFVECPNCQEELRVASKYAGKSVQCKLCNGQFRLDLTSRRIKRSAIYAVCPHCSEELRIAEKYLGKKVACKLCGGQLHPVETMA